MQYQGILLAFSGLMIRTLFAILLVTLTARAHDPVINPSVKAPTILRMFVQRGEIRADLEIADESLFAFRNLLPDAIYNELADDLGFEERQATDRRKRFFERDLILTLGGGKPLVGEIQEARWGKKTLRDLLSTEPLPAEKQKGPRAVHARIVYRFEGEPTKMSIRPPSRVLSRRSPMTSIGFRLYHLDVPVADYRILGQTEVVDLDWQDPWFTKFKNPRFFRFNRNLLQVFLYIEALEVRAEVVFRPRDLQEFVDLGLEGKERITVPMQKVIHDRLVAFLPKHLKLVIDGKDVKPDLASLNFLQLRIGNTEILDGVRESRAADTFLGAVFVVSRMGWPNEVKLTWDLYPRRAPLANAIVVDLEKGIPMELSKKFPELSWTNHLEDPPVPAFLVMPPPPEPARIPLPLVSLLVVILGLLAALFLRRRRAGPASWGSALLVALVLAFFLRPLGRTSLPDPFASRPALPEAEASLILEAALTNIYHAYDRRE